MDITNIIELILSVIVTILTLYAIPTLMNKFGAAKITSAYEIIKILVSAAEQICKVKGSGATKKNWVIERLASYNLQIDENKVSDLIESAVKEMNQSVKNNSEKKVELAIDGQKIAETSI